MFIVYGNIRNTECCRFNVLALIASVSLESCLTRPFLFIDVEAVMNYYNSCNFPPKSLHGWKYRTILKVTVSVIF